LPVNLTYEPQGHPLDALRARPAVLQAPAYAVLGNHDQQKRDLDRPRRARGLPGTARR
jgi:hypothetical protein